MGDYVCKPCCKISDDPPKAIFKDDYDCAPENVLEPKQCSLVCCNSPRGPSVSRYYCEQTGGTIVKCAQPPT